MEPCAVWQKSTFDSNLLPNVCASSKSSVKAPDAAHEILKYRENLKTLRNVIEKLQLSLLAEKGKIENLRANMRAARAWAAAVREISESWHGTWLKPGVLSYRSRRRQHRLTPR